MATLVGVLPPGVFSTSNPVFTISPFNPGQFLVPNFNARAAAFDGDLNGLLGGIGGVPPELNSFNVGMVGPLMAPFFQAASVQGLPQTVGGTPQLNNAAGNSANSLSAFGSLGGLGNIVMA